MNSNRLTLKDYIIIYFIVILIAVFLVGFFLGAKVMENRLSNVQAIVPVDNNLYSIKEIESFYNMFLSKALTLNQALDLQLKVNQDVKPEQLKILSVQAQELISNLGIYTFESRYLKESYGKILNNLQLITKALAEKEINNDQITEAYKLYLGSQQAFYREIWAWEQSLIKDSKDIQVESLTNWAEWKKANLHQKNYIVSTVLMNKSLISFHKPEDITVHIDAYIRANEANTLDFTEVINFLVKSDAVRENDFIKYIEWYTPINLPQIANFN